MTSALELQVVSTVEDLHTFMGASNKTLDKRIGSERASDAEGGAEQAMEVRPFRNQSLPNSGRLKQ